MWSHVHLEVHVVWDDLLWSARAIWDDDDAGPPVVLERSGRCAAQGADQVQDILLAAARSMSHEIAEASG